MDFCGHCGARLSPGPFPRTCTGCARPTWANPTPVAVLLVPVEDGLLIVQRNIEPKKGEWGLPGGYINLGETWEQACVRELYEETSVQAEAGDVELFDVHSVDTGKILIFGKLSKALVIDLDEINKTLPNEETQRVRIMREPGDLCFATHTSVASFFFIER